MAFDATGRAVLNEIATLARRENTEGEAGQFIVPDEIVLVADLNGIDDALC